MSLAPRLAAVAAAVAAAIFVPRAATAQAQEVRDTFGRVVITATSSVGRRPAETTYTVDQVDVAAQVLPRGPQARFPDSLRVAGVTGAVTVRFVIDRSGKPDMATFRVVSASHPEFADAVTTVVPYGLYTPARKGGQEVRQVVQQTFQFDIAERQRRSGDLR